MVQAATMITEIQNYYEQPVLIVTDSWFGNNGLWSRLDHEREESFHLLSRMRTNITLYDFAPAPTGESKVGRPRKYGQRLGSVDDCAAKLKEKFQPYTVFLYGKKKGSTGVFTSRYAENDEMPGASCLGLSEKHDMLPS